MSNITRQPDTKPSICFVVTSPAMLSLLTSQGPAATGGAELQLSVLGRALKEKGWEVSFLVGDYGQDRAIETSEGIRLLRAYSQPSTRPVWAILVRSLPEFWRSLAEIDADIYVSRGLTGQAGVIAAFAKLKRRRYVFWLAKNADAWYGVPRLSPLPFVERLPAWYGIHSADALIVQSNEQEALLRRYVGRSGVLVPSVSPWQDAVPDGQPGEYALWIASIQPKKRPHLLLDIAADMPQARFVMAGGKRSAYSSLYESVQARARQMPNVDFLGFVPFEQTKELFQRASVLVSTSKAEEEGFPNVLLQAWSTGTPVVATCDPDEVICRHGLGYHCEDATQIAERIREITGSCELQRQIGQRAYAYVSQHHSVDHITAKLSDFLQEVVCAKTIVHADHKNAEE